VDTSVWVEHLRKGSPRLAGLLRDTEVVCHPFVIGELACGGLRDREEVLQLLAELPQIPRLSDHDVLDFIERHGLHGRGAGWVDLHLLAACAQAGQPIWTTDRRLGRCASSLGLRFS